MKRLHFPVQHRSDLDICGSFGLGMLVASRSNNEDVQL